APLKCVAAVREWPALETAQTLKHVLRPADRFAELAVADNVDTGLRLPPHDLGDRFGQAAVMGHLVETGTLLLRAQKFPQLRRPDQAADMRGKNAIGAALHAELSARPAFRQICDQPGL